MSALQWKAALVKQPMTIIYTKLREFAVMRLKTIHVISPRSFVQEVVKGQRASDYFLRGCLTISMLSWIENQHLPTASNLCKQQAFSKCFYRTVVQKSDVIILERRQFHLLDNSQADNNIWELWHSQQTEMWPNSLINAFRKAVSFAL